MSLSQANGGGVIETILLSGFTSAKFNTAKLDAQDYYYSYRPYWWTHAEPEDYAEWFESAAVKELKQFANQNLIKVGKNMEVV